MSAVPALTCKVDWYASPRVVPTFAAAICTVHPLDQPPMQIVRGRNPDFSADQPG